LPIATGQFEEAGVAGNGADKYVVGSGSGDEGADDAVLPEMVRGVKTRTNAEPLHSCSEEMAV
jgi:hypothetical protein